MDGERKLLEAAKDGGRLLYNELTPVEAPATIIVTHSNALLDELRDPVASIRAVTATPQSACIRRLGTESLTAWRIEYS